MYYDVRNHVGTVLGADMLTPAPGYEGKVRLHADVLQQIGEDHFRAQDAFVTSSRLGIPRYRLQMSEATFDDRQTPRVDWLGNPVMDPKTGQPLVDHQELVAAQNNLLYIEERADLLLADVRHGPERSVVLPPPHPIQGRRRFRLPALSPIGPPTSCWASRTARREPIGP